MSIEGLIDAFRLPAQALVAQRIPKKMLVEQGAPTAADKRLINDTVDELWWHAALKPGTIAVPAFRAASHAAAEVGGEPAGAVAAGDVSQQGNGAQATQATPAVADVIELALVFSRLRPGVRDAQAQRLRQLIHRAIPYPVLLVADAPTSAQGGVVLSLAHKRLSLGEAGKWVLASTAETHPFNPGQATATEAQFLASLALDQMPRSALLNLAALYQGYADRVTALAVAQVTGQFAAGAVGAAAATQRQVLAQRQQFLQQLSAARDAAAKARQLNQRVALNLQIQRLQGELQHIDTGLCR